ncbi:hypothetical protein MAPG_10990 [Magnaporthiopsis poae ATCC 64411]|uniref:Uncharacterized protein n=1 Tax=Magnaporthiopsis poae (strain ATCC 64411 / 73-15) TaxID=644358 RepID=A0A0C4EE25_MAGP6|nr:hypothetical protein MAPG_10990 [Magnaporthiopsis poae ATCC 64411]
MKIIKKNGNKLILIFFIKITINGTNTFNKIGKMLKINNINFASRIIIINKKYQYKINAVINIKRYLSLILLLPPLLLLPLAKFNKFNSGAAVVIIIISAGRQRYIIIIIINIRYKKTTL